MTLREGSHVNEMLLGVREVKRMLVGGLITGFAEEKQEQKSKISVKDPQKSFYSLASMSYMHHGVIHHLHTRGRRVLEGFWF